MKANVEGLRDASQLRVNNIQHFDTKNLHFDLGSWREKTQRGKNLTD